MHGHRRRVFICICVHVSRGGWWLSSCSPFIVCIEAEQGLPQTLELPSSSVYSQLALLTSALQALGYRQGTPPAIIHIAAVDTNSSPHPCAVSC